MIVFRLGWILESDCLFAALLFHDNSIIVVLIVTLDRSFELKGQRLLDSYLR